MQTSPLPPPQHFVVSPIPPPSHFQQVFVQQPPISFPLTPRCPFPVRAALPPPEPFPPPSPFEFEPVFQPGPPIPTAPLLFRAPFPPRVETPTRQPYSPTPRFEIRARIPPPRARAPPPRPWSSLPARQRQPRAQQPFVGRHPSRAQFPFRPQPPPPRPQPPSGPQSLPRSQLPSRSQPSSGSQLPSRPQLAPRMQLQPRTQFTNRGQFPPRPINSATAPQSPPRIMHFTTAGVELHPRMPLPFALPDQHTAPSFTPPLFTVPSTISYPIILPTVPSPIMPSAPSSLMMTPTPSPPMMLPTPPPSIMPASPVPSLLWKVVLVPAENGNDNSNSCREPLYNDVQRGNLQYVINVYLFFVFCFALHLFLYRLLVTLGNSYRVIFTHEMRKECLPRKKKTQSRIFMNLLKVQCSLVNCANYKWKEHIWGIYRIIRNSINHY